ncbi:MAG TPA: hypothetical protein VKF32_08305 [Thermoanaerobaculia bacterium]|nr:hypothetical protein [Thermoanaerobaculia bacterium]
MKSLKALLVVLVVAACALLAARFAAQERRASRSRAAVARHDEVGDRSGRTAAERKAIARVHRAGFRPAEDVDALESDSRDELEDVYVTYHPYFVRGDLDGDGRLDFAQAYVYKVGGETRFDVAVFFGNEEGTFTGPIVVERGLDLAGGDLAIERTVLIVTPDLSEDDVHRWRYDPRDQRFHDTDEGKPSDGDVPDEGPDERPRARV